MTLFHFDKINGLYIVLFKELFCVFSQSLGYTGADRVIHFLDGNVLRLLRLDFFVEFSQCFFQLEAVFLLKSLLYIVCKHNISVRMNPSFLLKQ